MTEHDDELLRALGRVAAEDEADVQRLERIAAGAPEATDVEALDDEAAEAAKPLGLAVEDRIAREIAGHVSRPEKRVDRRARGWAVVGALAAAAALLVVTRGDHQEGLPAFHLSASGAAVQRGPTTAPSEACVVDASRDGDVEIVGQPDTAVAEPVRALAFALRGDAVTPVPFVSEVSPKGSFLLRGDRKLLRGARELRVVVTRAALEGEAATHARTGDRGVGYRVLRCPVVE